jgi:uncharacterized protein (TIGR02001 family)
MNLKSSFSSQLRTLMLGTVVSAASLAIVPAAHAGLTGNIGIFSKYALRGVSSSSDNPAITAESDGTAIQGGFDWSHDSGLFLGYWGSNLDYTYAANFGTASGGSGFENDFYGGYAGKAGAVSFSIGATQYLYIEVDESNLLEPFATVGVGPVTLGVKYLAQDGFWGNEGDMYWTLAYSTGLPKGFKFSAVAGYYLYEDNDSPEICGGDQQLGGCLITTTDSEFRHVDLTLSHPIAATGAEMLMTVIIGGEDRSQNSLDSTVVLGVKYGFDI